VAYNTDRAGNSGKEWQRQFFPWSYTYAAGFGVILLFIDEANDPGGRDTMMDNGSMGEFMNLVNQAQTK